MSSKTGSITPSTNLVEIADSSLTHAEKAGNIVSLSLCVRTKAKVSSYTSIATVSSGFRPKSSSVILCRISDVTRPINVGTDGSMVTTTELVQGSLLYISGSYVAS